MICYHGNAENWLNMSRSPAFKVHLSEIYHYEHGQYDNPYAPDHTGIKKYHGGHRVETIRSVNNTDLVYYNITVEQR